MQKRIFAVAIILMVFVLVAVACGKKDKTNDPGSSEPFSYTTDPDGTLYVTNIYGDLIPVTTGADGSVELLEDLYTKTLAQVEEEKQNMEKTSNNATGNASGGQGEGSSQGEGGNKGETPSGGNSDSQGGIQVGSDEAVGDDKEAIINW